MATLRKKRKAAALSSENCDNLPRRNLAQKSNVRRSQKDYITQVSVEIEGRATKRLSQEFSWTENHILGALSSVDDLLMNAIIQGHSGTTPETSPNAYGSNQGTNEDDSQSDPYPEAVIFQSQTAHNSGPEDGHNSDTWFKHQSGKVYQAKLDQFHLHIYSLKIFCSKSEFH